MGYAFVWSLDAEEGLDLREERAGLRPWGVQEGPAFLGESWRYGGGHLDEDLGCAFVHACRCHVGYATSGDVSTRNEDTVVRDGIEECHQI